MKVRNAGVFYRPIDTPAGKQGWYAEIFFSYPWYVRDENKKDISKRFDTKEEADKFFAEKMNRLEKKRIF